MRQGCQIEAPEKAVTLFITRLFDVFSLIFADVEGFNRYIENYKAALPVEKAAVEFKK